MTNLKIKSINNTTKVSELSDEMMKLYMQRFYSDEMMKLYMQRFYFDKLKRVIREN